MGDKQNSRLDEDESSPAPVDGSEQEKSGEPRSYYYDDATGYEIYKEEDETDEDADEQD
jgi:hypothetical protein